MSANGDQEDRTMSTDNDFFLTAGEIEQAYGIDFTSAETIRHGLIEVSRHMHGTLQRSAFSNIVRDGMDFGVCVHLINDDGSTELVAVTEGCTMFAFTHQHMANIVLDEYGIENMGPGDTLVCNDSFRGGIHFGDLNLFRVVHDDDGRPAFAISDAAHVFDIGGPVPGGFNLQAENMFEEGLRLPPTLITSRDEPVRSAMGLLLDNTRSPLHMVGDVRALLGTLRAGEERVRALIERYGADAVRAGARYALGLSERRMRKALREIPDGDYAAEQDMDDDGVTTDPVKLKVTLRVRGDAAEIDFSGTDRQTLGPITTGWEEAGRCLIGPKVVLDPRHPMNAGAMKPFEVLLPPGSLVLGLPPTSQSNHTELGAKICSVMLRLMSEAVPDKAVASDSGTSGAVLVYGSDNRPGRKGSPYGAGLLFGEAWGGTASADGISYCLSPLYNCRANVIELVEKECPLVIWEWGTTLDGAGAGRHRGGFGPFMTIEAFAATTCTPLLDSANFGPTPIQGGSSGMPSYGMLIDKDARGRATSWNGIFPADRMTPLFGKYDDQGRPDPVAGEFGNGARYLTAKTQIVLEPGQILRLQTASAAGCGDPLERDPRLVHEDVRNERVTARQAREVYGVVLDAEGGLDLAATGAERSAREGGPPPVTYKLDWPTNDAELEALASAELAAVGGR
jgi:N-methylhydantoinase B